MPSAATHLFCRRASLVHSAVNLAESSSHACFAPGCLLNAPSGTELVLILQFIGGTTAFLPKTSPVWQCFYDDRFPFNRLILLFCQDGEVMTARCKACWLKLALTGFQMRDSDHDDLRKLLPTFMQDTIPLAVNRPTVVHWAPNRGQMIRMKSNSSSTPNVV